MNNNNNFNIIVYSKSGRKRHIALKRLGKTFCSEELEKTNNGKLNRNPIYKFSGFTGPEKKWCSICKKKYKEYNKITKK